MQLKFSLLLIASSFIGSIWTKDCAKLKSNTKLFCYYGEIQESESFCQCTHLVIPEATEMKILEKIRKQNADVKILLTVSEFNEKLVNLLKGTRVDGLELSLRKIDSKNDLTDFISTVKSKLGSDYYIAVSVPSKTETLAKNFDFKELSKHADVFILNTAFLGASQNVTFHPSRLSGLWDMQNTDSMVDLVSGLGAPLSKIVIAAPVQAFSFTLQNEKYTAPGSPATEVKSITRKELCDLMIQKDAEWTLERDQDQTGPYIFRGKQWIAFEDEISIDIKTKYARVRGLSGFALKDLSQDSETKCGSSILNAAFKGLSKQARAPRGAVLHSLEREILSPASPHSASVHDSPFRISRIIDTEGKIHVVRQDTRTEFECSRQGYFVHPRSCNRFYRCVKFDQRTEDYNVFEFDCPSGLTFDEKTEVCVWPGSLPHASACSGSSEIAPVPKKRFTCPTEPGYYADPENCRWFFACLDHGEPSMQAYEFRCPFGLVFDEEKLLCEWSWLVPRCGSRTTVTLNYYGGISNINQYDGLGVLQTLKLGGLQGPIQAAEAKTYSNVGIVGLADKSLSDSRLFSENSARFIDASRRLGLSLRATQSLYDAGLLSEKLAAIGLSQQDLSIDGLASEVNSGLYQNSANIGQHAIALGVSNQYAGNQNQGYKQAGQNGDKLLLQTGFNTNSGSGDTFRVGSQSDQYNVLSSGQQSSHQIDVGQANIKNGVQYGQDYISNSAQNGNIQTFANFVQKSADNQGGFNFEQNGVANLGLNLAQQNVENEARYQQSITNGLVKDLSGSSLISNQNSQGYIQVDSDSRRLNEGLKTKTEGETGYSSSYLNLGTASNSQFDGNLGISQINTNKGKLDLNQNQYQNIQSAAFGEDRDIEQIRLGLNAYRQNSGHLLQNVEINGAAGTYINDNHESNLNLALDSSDITHVTPSSVSHTTASSFESIVSATPLETNEYNEEKQSVGDAGIAYSINNLQESKGYNKYEENNSGKEATSFQFVGAQKPVFVSSTPSFVVEQNSGRLTDTKYSGGLLGVSQIQFVSSTPRPETLEIRNERLNPSIASEGVIFKQQVLSVPTQQKEGQRYSENGGYNYAKPTIRFEEKPQVLIHRVNPAIASEGVTLNQQVLSVSTQQKEGQRYSENGGYNYAKPTIRLEEKPQVLIQKNTIISSTPSYIRTETKIPSSSTSFSYSNRGESNENRGRLQENLRQSYIAPSTYSIYSNQKTVDITHLSPQVPIEQPQIVSTFSYVKPESPNNIAATSYNALNRNQQQITQNSFVATQEPRVLLNKPSSVSASYSYVRPTVQSQISFGQPQVNVQQPVQIVESYNTVRPSFKTESYVNPQISQSFSYTQQNRNGGYKYEVPEVKVEVQPQTIESSKVLEQTNFLVKNGGYKYDKPAVEFREGANVAKQQTVQLLKQYNQPNLQRQEFTSYQYIQPVVQQPSGFTKTNFQKEAVKTYSYSNAGKTQYIARPATIVSTSYQSPIVKNEHVEFKGYGYPKPQVQFIEEPKAVVTNYENKVPVVEAPIIPKKAYVLGNELQYQRVVPKVQLLKEQVVYSTPKPTFISTVNSLVSKKIKPLPQREYIYYDSRLDNKQTQYFQASRPEPVRNLAVSYTPTAIPNNEAQGYRYPEPAVRFEERPRTPTQKTYQYFQSDHSIQQKTQPQFLISSTPRPSFYSTVQSIVTQKSVPLDTQYVTSPPGQIKYLESTTLKPLSRVTSSFTSNQQIANVEINGYVDQKPQILNYHYNQNENTNQQQKIQVNNFENQHYIQPTTERISAVEIQKSAPITREYFYHDSRSTSTQGPRIEVVETSTRTPVIQNIQRVEFKGYEYPTPQVSFEDQNDNTKQQQKIQVEYFENQQYVQPKTEKTTVVEIQKSAPITREYFYHDSRLTNTQGPKIDYIESSTRTPIIQKNQRVEFGGYEYPKPQVNFEEGQVTGYENKEPVVEPLIVPKKAYVTTEQRYSYEDNSDVREQTAKPVVLENYVASNYQKQFSNSRLEESNYVTPKTSFISTLAPVVTSKPIINQEFTFYDSRLSSTPRTEKVETSTSQGYIYEKPKVQLSEEPPQLTYVQENKQNQQITLENYVSPDYKTYDEPRQSSTPVTILNQNVRQEVGYQIRQKSGYLEASEAPEVNIDNRENQEIILENYVSPDYNKYNERIQSSTPAIILSQNARQEVGRYQNRQRSGYLKKTEAFKTNLEISRENTVQKLEQQQPIQPFYFYDSRLTNEKSNSEIVQEGRKSLQETREEISSYDNRYSSTASPSRIKTKTSVTIVEEEQPIATTARQRYTVDTSTERLGIKYAEIDTQVPSSTYAPIRKRIRVTKPSREYLPTSSTPSLRYLPSTTSEPTPREYSAIKSSESIAEGDISVENYENFELVRKKSRPVKVVKIVRPRVKTVVVKKNDFNPFLSAKLGAQCTCTSNTLELRKEPLRIEVIDEDDDDESEEGIIVENKDGDSIVVEDYQSGRIEGSTIEPEVYIKSTTVEVPSSTYRSKKLSKGRSRSQNVVIENISSRRKSKVTIEASDVNIVASRVRVKTPRVDIETEDNAEVNIESKRSRTKKIELESEEETEVSSKSSDSYRSGRLRSNSETLQGVDCQRAGLFRHPTQCNKFYSCRWDCKKNKFTLHVFNCPVHLTFDNNLGACNWPSQGPTCMENTLLPSE